jgi:hypothetical protein
MMATTTKKAGQKIYAANHFYTARQQPIHDQLFMFNLHERRISFFCVFFFIDVDVPRD